MYTKCMIDDDDAIVDCRMSRICGELAEGHERGRLRRELVLLRRAEGAACIQNFAADTKKNSPRKARAFFWWRRRELNPRPRTRRRRSTTCVSPFSCRSRLETEPSAPAANPDMSHCHASGRNVAASLLNHDKSRAVDTLKLIAHRLLSGESVVCV